MIFVLVTVLLNIKYLDLKSYRSMGLDSLHAGEGNGSRQGKHASGCRKLAGYIFIYSWEAKREKKKQKVGKARHPQSPVH